MFSKKIVGIAACDPHGIMGKDGKLPWHCAEDLKHFADATRGHPLVMGYQTFLALPPSYFDRRLAIVFSRRKISPPINPHLIFVSSLADFLALEQTLPEGCPLYVIGGAQIYTLFLQENLIAEFILTLLTDAYAGDTLFPLQLLTSWPSIEVRKTPAFAIRHYFNPRCKYPGETL